MKKYVITTIVVRQKCLSGLKKILKYNLGEKSLKAPFAICLDLECLLKKNNLAKTIPKNHIQRKKLHDPSGWAMFTRCSFNEKKINLIITEEKIVLKNCVKS